MTEYLRLPNDLKARIEQAAQAHGKTAEQTALDALQHSFPPAPAHPTQELRDMLALWRAEDLAMTEEESEINSRMMESIDAHRSSYRKVYQDILQEPVVP